MPRRLRQKPFIPEAFRDERAFGGKWTIRDRLSALLEEELAFGRVFLFAPFILATGAIWWFARPVAPSFWGMCAYAALSLAAALRLRHGQALPRLAALALALFLAGAVLAALQTMRTATVMLDSTVVTHVSGIVTEREKTTTGWRYVIDVDATSDPVIHRPPERVALIARGGEPVAIGSGLSGLARLSPPSAPALPGLVDFGFLSYFDGIGAIGYFYGPPKPAVLNAGQGDEAGFALRISRLRETIAGRIRAVLPGETGAFANAIITGERRAMSDATLDALRNAGLAHIIAISGLHMALAAGIFFASLRVLLAFSIRSAEAYPTKKLAAIAALAAAFFYLLISGMQVSAQRAFLMLAIMLVAAIADRPAISLRNVAIAAFVILALSPSEASGPGMQMSFAATAALIAGYALWQRSPARRTAEPERRGLPRMIFLFFSGILLTALIGGSSTTAFAIAHFQRVAGYGLIGNLLAMPVITFVVMPAGLAAMLAMPLNLHAPFLVVMGAGLDWVTATAFWVDRLGGAFSTGKAPAGFLPLFVAGFVLFVLLRTRLRHIGLAPMLLSFALLARAGDDGKTRLLVSEEGDLLAVAWAQTAAVNTARPNAFIFEQWQSALSLADTIAPATIDVTTAFIDSDDRSARLAGAEIGLARSELGRLFEAAREAPGQFQCQKNLWCAAFMEKGGPTVIQVLHPGLVGPACDKADIVVSLYRTGYQHCRSGHFLSTPELRRQAGAMVFTLEPDNVADAATARSIVPESIHTPGIIDATQEKPVEAPNTLPTSAIDMDGCMPIEVTLSPSVTDLQRQWNSHRLYDWRNGQFRSPTPLPQRLRFNDSDGSGRRACPEP